MRNFLRFNKKQNSMRYAIIADIHSNLDAFQVVLQDIENRGGVEEIWCLGDIVGYGPQPVECIELLRRHCHICVAGNHDLAATGKLDTTCFNHAAAEAASWTAGRLSPEDIDYLQSLPLKLEREDFTLVHGSPREPVWEYVVSPPTAAASFAYFDTRFCLIGHSHVPMVFDLDRDGICNLQQLPEELGLMQEEKRLIINCGAVGQPRDGDPRASYAILDCDRGILYHYRVEYDILAVQQKMTELGLPSRLSSRLSHGF